MNDITLRVRVYDHIVTTGEVPRSEQLAAQFGVGAAEVRERLARLGIGKTMLVHPQGGEIWMAGPFASAPCGYTLTDGRTQWFANCGWDAYGVAMIVGRKLDATATCPDCGEQLAFVCDPERPPATDDLTMHFLLPARRWYDDIGFT
jgi:Alkylmercury lyase